MQSMKNRDDRRKQRTLFPGGWYWKVQWTKQWGGRSWKMGSSPGSIIHYQWKLASVTWALVSSLAKCSWTSVLSTWLWYGLTKTRLNESKPTPHRYPPYKELWLKITRCRMSHGWQRHHQVLTDLLGQDHHKLWGKDHRSFSEFI